MESPQRHPFETRRQQPVQPESNTEIEKLPTFSDEGQDHRTEWGRLLQGSEEDFPTEASFANHYFSWPHMIEGERRDEFDCTKENSFKLIPPDVYLKAYYAAREHREI